jgi:hypothetical protein
MKKTIFNVCIAVFFSSVLFLISFSAYNAIKGNSLKMYLRFNKVDTMGNVTFNPWSLISPFQIESQKIVKDVKFETEITVLYPVAPTFKMINPADTSAEITVANQIAKAIADSIKKVTINNFFNYDGTSKIVRDYINPVTIQTVKPKINLFLTGTASPEAKKYGFMQSIQPGNYEVENTDLAKQRLDRTATVLLRKLHSVGINTVKLYKKSVELQFSKSITDSIVAVKQLQNMRYVRAHVYIPMENVTITPVTAPIMLPIWIALITLLTSLFSRLRFKNSGNEEEKKQPKTFDWIQFFKNISATLLVLTILIAGIIILPYIAKYVLIFLGLFFVGVILFGIILMIRTLSIIGLWRGTVKFFSSILQYIKRGICWILLYSVIYISNIYEWWKVQTTCRKVLLVHFLVDVIILITWLLGWWHIC